MGAVLFRVESGVGVGLGHLQRCLSLAAALLELDHASHFVASGGASARARIERSGFTFVDLGDATPGSGDDTRLVLEEMQRRACGAVVVDSYVIDAAFMACLRAPAATLVAIDDLARGPLPADVIVNAAIGVEEAAYAGSPERARLLLGPDHALLGPPYWDPAEKVVKDGARRVLVTMGGADGQNLTPLLLASLDSLDVDLAVTAVVGPFNGRQSEIEDAVRRCKRPVSLITEQESLEEHMAMADVAVSAAGQTLYELAATGTPTVAVQVAENQASNVVGLVEHGCVEPVILDDRAAIGRTVADKVAALIADRGRRVAMSLAGRRLVDGQGARRVAGAISLYL